jgi:hypothetical protein
VVEGCSTSKPPAVQVSSARDNVKTENAAVATVVARQLMRLRVAVQDVQPGTGYAS